MDSKFVLDYNLLADKELVKVYSQYSTSQQKLISRDMLLHVPLITWLDSNVGPILEEFEVGLEFIVGQGWHLHNYMYDYEMGTKSEIWFDPFVEKKKITEFALRWVK